MPVNPPHHMPIENESFVNMLNSAAVDIDTAPLGEDYDETAVDYEIGAGDGSDEECKDGGSDEGCEEVHQEDTVAVLIDGAALVKNKSVRTAKYNNLEGAPLIKAWESVSIDPVTGTDPVNRQDAPNHPYV